MQGLRSSVIYVNNYQVDFDKKARILAWNRQTAAPTRWG